MNKMKLKKFSIYEFELEAQDSDSQSISVIYKKDEEDPSASIVSVSYENGNRLEIPVNLLTSLHSALSEIDPYAFVFSDMGDK